MPANRPRTLRVLGIMTGTSIDGVDYALCRVSRHAIRLLHLWHAGYPSTLQLRLHAAARGESGCHEVAQLHHDLGRFFARHARRHPAGRPPELVGLHGQTVFHRPAPRQPATFQIGEPAYLAETLGVPVVANFRAADLAAGGQGAPLATLFHVLVFGRRGRHVCVHNLGGISNVTSIDWRHGHTPAVLAFDTGPANVLLDLAARRVTQGRRPCDVDGRLAARGRADELLVSRWLRHPYFRRRPPKSTGRELFGERFFADAIGQLAGRSPADILATFTEFTARSIALNYDRHLPAPADTVVLCGGGIRNPVLVDRISAQLHTLNPRTRIRAVDSLGWPGQAVEPAAFALLAWHRWFGLPSTLPATTGARHPTSGGQVALAPCR